MAKKREEEKLLRSIFWDPVCVYSTEDRERNYDYGKQIEIYNDSSFLLTEDGLIYSWGKYENGFLGREATIVLNPIDDQGEGRKQLL